MSVVTGASSGELSVLLEGLTSAAVPGGVHVRGLACSSEAVHAGDLFLALRGRSFDGFDFLHEAAARGAVAAAYEAAARRGSRVSIPAVPVGNLSHKAGIIADRFFGHPSAAMHVTAVTGTDGKSSVAHLLAEAVRLRHEACGLIGTLGYGLFGELRRGVLTTPAALDIHRELYSLHSQGSRHVVLEASSHGLDQGRLVGVDTDVAVFTNLGRDHLDYHGSIEKYAAAKEKLFSPGGIRDAVVNVGDPFGRELAARCRQHCRVTTYALDTEADVCASDIACTMTGLEFGVHAHSSRFPVRSRLLGYFNVLNLLAVFSALLAQGISPAEAASLLCRLHPVPGRMQRVVVGERCAIVDYAHTPQALETLLRACRHLVPGKVLCVFGCGGERDRGKRPLMGRLASRLADVVLITDDNPRGEDPRRIAGEIQAGTVAGAEVSVIHGRERAIRRAVSIAGRDDCIVVSGKGHESFQLVGGERLDFDDVSVLSLALREVP